jgi:hypothetical protein
MNPKTESGGVAGRASEFELDAQSPGWFIDVEGS